ncbi:manganese efflux pump [Sinanaerobacter chloroacetimidivorans]|jgi:putative sporulation protein YtaF|uniref:Manganese efflux pump n=1 Tax=Sinanaerobacter chloroacetimidivorans TaxID=2818044 RepID=A0A8J8B3C6_9FIRM|nr:manganese efflux pump [Sinanaerobacter chloroacetimidivorans]MBR0599617.1 manganese efflux pump [Sinanaerobacter chloroacetimidivorans]
MYAFLLALSLNIDSLSIGVNYGLRKIKISFPALITIVMMSLGALTLSFSIGHIIFSFVSIFVSKMISSFLLISLGCVLFAQTLMNIHYPAASEAFIIKKIKIKPLNIIVNIVREPENADIDHSGVIDFKEAIYIGSALSIDALTIGLSLAAYQIHLPGFLILTAVTNFSFLVCGELIGKFVGKFISENKLKMAASITLILLGLTKLA